MLTNYGSKFCPVHKSMDIKLRCTKIRTINVMYLTLQIGDVLTVRPQNLMY